MTDADAFRDAVAEVEAKYGPVSLLVNNAGVMLLGDVSSQDPDDWRRMFEVNVLGLLNGVRQVISGMIEHRDGTIVNFGSVAGIKTFTNHAVHCGTKFAVHAMTEGIREEVANKNVRLITIAPGVVETELLGHTRSEEIKDLWTNVTVPAGAVDVRLDGYVIANDYARATVEGLGRENSVVVANSTGAVLYADWTAFELTLAPFSPGSLARVRVRLGGRRVDGFFTDAYFDDLQLRPLYLVTTGATTAATVSTATTAATTATTAPTATTATPVTTAPTETSAMATTTGAADPPPTMLSTDSSTGNLSAGSMAVVTATTVGNNETIATSVASLIPTASSGDSTSLSANSIPLGSSDGSATVTTVVGVLFAVLVCAAAAIAAVLLLKRRQGPGTAKQREMESPGSAEEGGTGQNPNKDYGSVAPTKERRSNEDSNKDYGSVAPTKERSTEDPNRDYGSVAPTKERC